MTMLMVQWYNRSQIVKIDGIFEAKTMKRAIDKKTQDQSKQIQMVTI